MLKLLTPALIAGACAVAGGAAGLYLKTGSTAPAGATAPVEAEGGSEGHAAPDAKKDEKSNHGASAHDKKAKGGHGSSGSSGTPTYYKFSREFVVPIIGEERVKSLVILNLNLEIDPSASDDLFSREPVLRDNIMTTLIELSSRPEVFNGLNDVENYEMMRSRILENLRTAVSDGINNVLILDMARQDL